MNIEYKTSQERFWVGTFGDEYSVRNQGLQLEASNLTLFANILSHTESISSVLELGANIGLNLAALKRLTPAAELSAVEINPKALESLRQLDDVAVYPGSILDFRIDVQRDLVFTKGVLIHIDPESLSKVYDVIHDASRRYIGLVEYYNPTPVEVEYRGHVQKLFKRDFAGEMLDRFPDLTLVHYGFAYHRDRHFPQDDLTWFLLEKRL